MAARLTRRAAGVVASAWMLAPGALGAGSPAGPRAAVIVEWGVKKGPESLRAFLQEELLEALRSAGCLDGVAELVEGPAADLGGDDLQLRVVIERYSDETVFEHGAAYLGSDDPELQGRVVAEVEGDFRALARVGETTLREQRFRSFGSWRPLAGEDARVEAERRLVEDAVRRVRRLACKGGSQKWQRQIDGARGAEAPDAR